MVLHIAGWGIDHARLGHLLHHALLQDVGEWLEPRLHACVLAQPDECRRPALRRDLVVEQRAQPGKYRCSGVEEGHLMVQPIVVDAELQVVGLLENLQVLALDDLLGAGYVGDRRVVFCQSLGQANIGRVLYLHIEQHLGVLVAAHNPGRVSRRSRRGGFCSSRRGRLLRCGSLRLS